jgi:hypothetical protein
LRRKGKQTLCAKEASRSASIASEANLRGGAKSIAISTVPPGEFACGPRIRDRERASHLKRACQMPAYQA